MPSSSKTKPKAKRPARKRQRKKTPVRYCSERKRDGSPCKGKAMRDSTLCSAHARLAGRKSVIDSKLRESFMSALGTGVGIQVAAAFAGIAYRTAYNWLERGEQELAGGVSEEDSEYVAFLQGVTRTRAEVQVRLAGYALSAAAKTDSGRDGRIALQMLEALAPAEWGRNRIVHHEHSGQIDLLDGAQPIDLPRTDRLRIVEIVRASQEQPAIETTGVEK